MAQPADRVLREFASIGKYRIRILEANNGSQLLDIREYVRDEKFEGYTRRGIRLSIPTDTAALTTILGELQPTSGSSPAAKPGRKPR